MLKKIITWAKQAIEENSGYRLVLDYLSENPMEAENVVVASVGKASLSMARAAKEILGERIKKGIIVSNKEGELEGFDFYVGSHPYPDQRSLKAGQALLDLAKSCSEDDTVLFLISGGASALAVLPHPPFTLQDLTSIHKALLLSGANIHEINTVRRHISLIKGGRLAEAFFPARVITLAISDVKGDLPEDIGSGPTVPDRSSLEEAIKIMKKYGLEEHIEKIKKVPETPKPSHPIFQKNNFFLLANTLKILKDIENKAKAEGIRTLILTGEDGGEAREVSKVYAGIIWEVLRSGNPLPPPLLILSGGELTVTVKGKGKGGRNTEFILSLLIETMGLDGKFSALSMGTDGIDGPTDAAGAFFSDEDLERAWELKPEAYLEENDSYTFFEKLGLLIKTGPTDTNLRDIRIFWIEKRKGH